MKKIKINFFKDIKVKHPRFIRKDDFVIVQKKKKYFKNLKRKYLELFKII